MPDDLGDALKDDYKKYKRLQSMGEGEGLSLTTKMEYTFWTGAVISVAAMIIAMFFIDPAVHGRIWLFGSLGAICAFGGLALITRQLPEV